MVLVRLVGKYLTKVLKLPKDALKYQTVQFKDELKHVNEPEEEMTKMLDSQLENNHATILCLFYADLTFAKGLSFGIKYISINKQEYQMINQYLRLFKHKKFKTNGHAIVVHKETIQLNTLIPKPSIKMQIEHQLMKS